MLGHYFSTHQDAQSAAARLAREASKSSRVVFPEFSGGNNRERAAMPVEGGKAFAVKLAIDGWEVEELDMAEVADRIVIGRRRAVDDLRARAEASKIRAAELLGSKFAERHHQEARRLILAAEELLNGADDAYYSSDRDQRVAS